MTTATALRNRPTFLVIGAMRSGSTSLYGYLRQHPQIFMASPKELHFFVDGRNWSRGVEWYEQQFMPGAELTARGECSVTYTQFQQFEGVPERIASVIPDVRMVYLVRNPVERIRSHFELRMAAGHENGDFETAIRTRSTYLDTTRYAAQLERFFEFFPREQFYVATTESLIAHPETLAGICSFVGVDPDAIPRVYDRGSPREQKSAPLPAVRRMAALAPVHAVASLLPGSAKKALKRHAPRQPMTEIRTEVSPATRRWIHERLRDDVAQLHNYMSVPFDGWGIA